MPEESDSKILPTGAPPPWTEEFLSQLRTLPVAVLADVLDRLGHRHQVMSSRMRSVACQRRIAGPAFTIQAVARAAFPERPYEKEIEATDAVPDGSVIAFNAGGVTEAGVWGELLATRAGARGCIGAVVDGGVRDLAGIERLGFPTYATAIHPSDSYGRVEVISYGEPIVCGGVPIRCEDLIVADLDGIVSIPYEVAGEAVAAALAKRSKEREAQKMLDGGATVAATYARHRVL
jgi:4-hydroxy-4-methyl-2-oxoglutarate aldolase